MSTLFRLQALNDRLDTILFASPFDDRPDPKEGIQPEHVGAMAGAAGGIAAGATLPSIARRTARAPRPAGMGARIASNIPRPIRAANRLTNRKVAGLGMRGRGVAAGILGIGGAIAGHYAGRMLNPDFY